MDFLVLYIRSRLYNNQGYSGISTTLCYSLQGCKHYAWLQPSTVSNITHGKFTVCCHGIQLLLVDCTEWTSIVYPHVEIPPSLQTVLSGPLHHLPMYECTCILACYVLTYISIFRYWCYSSGRSPVGTPSDRRHFTLPSDIGPNDSIRYVCTCICLFVRICVLVVQCLCMYILVCMCPQYICMSVRMCTCIYIRMYIHMQFVQDTHTCVCSTYV